MSTKISIRMDDISPDMDWTKFMRFKALCDKYRIRPLVGVVPDNQDPNLHLGKPSDAPGGDFWGYMRELEKEGWCIAQHGVTHIYTTKKMGCFPLNRLSEFAGTGYERQYRALERGKEILASHGISTDIFMAPAHSFDRDTIKALKKLGFRRLTDGFGDRPYTRWGMTFYPISYRQGSVLKSESGSGYTTFVVHANMMGDREFERYEQIFADCQDRLVSYSELLRLSPVKRGVFGDLREYVMAFVKFSLVYVKGRMHGGAA